MTTLKDLQSGKVPLKFGDPKQVAIVKEEDMKANILRKLTNHKKLNSEEERFVKPLEVLEVTLYYCPYCQHTHDFDHYYPADEVMPGDMSSWITERGKGSESREYRQCDKCKGIFKHF